MTVPAHRRQPVAHVGMDRSDRRLTRSLVLGWLVVVCAAVISAQAPKIDTSLIGPRIGQRVPDFSGTDQFGRTQTLASSLGAKGVMLVFFRSADW
jgi:hypothetical protein